MARQKAEDSFLYLIFRQLSAWALLAILAMIYGTLRYLLPFMLGSHHWLTAYSIAYAPVLTVVAALFALRTEWDKHQRPSPLAKQTGLDTLWAMSWQEFEQLVGEAYRRMATGLRKPAGAARTAAWI